MILADFARIVTLMEMGGRGSKSVTVSWFVQLDSYVIDADELVSPPDIHCTLTPSSVK